MKQKEKTLTLENVKMKIDSIGNNSTYKGIIFIILLIISIFICKFEGIYETPHYSEENYEILEQAVPNFIVEDEILHIKKLQDNEIQYSVENIEGGYKISLSKKGYELEAEIINGKETINRHDTKTSYLLLNYISRIFIAPLLAVLEFAVVDITWLIIYLIFSAIDAIYRFFNVLKSQK